MKKFIFFAGIALGFFIGSAAGRGPYEQLDAKAREIANDPTVQEKAQAAKDKAGVVAKDAAATVKEKAPEAAAAVKDKAPDVAAAVKDAASKAATTVSSAASSATASVKSAVSSDEIEDADGTHAGDAEVKDSKPLSS